MTQTTFDLSALPDITDGTHTVKVKAKADSLDNATLNIIQTTS